MSLILRDAVTDFIERMEDVSTRMHNAIEDGDIDLQHAALAAIVGLTEMLRSAVENGEPEEDAS
jgi:hypothetical protein